MANRDYAAGIDPRRRISLWGKITKGINLETDWNSAPPLTAGLRERFPDLLSRRSPVNEPPVPPIPRALQPGRHATVDGNPRPNRVDGVNNLEAKERIRRELPRTIVLGGVRHQRSVNRRPSQRSRSQQNSHQQKIREANPDHDLPSAASTHGRVQSATHNADVYESSRSALAHFPSPTHQQQQCPTHDLRQHTTNFPHLPSPNPIHPSSHTRTLRRVPVQSSLRNQVFHDANQRTEVPQVRNRNSCTATATSHTVPAVVQTGAYSHYPAYSPLPLANPHALPRSYTRSSSAARYVSTQDLQQAISPPTSPSNTPELQDHVEPHDHTEPQEHAPFSPPFAHPSPIPPRNISIETFANPNNPTCPPLSKHDADMEALRERILSPCRNWKARVGAVWSSVKGVVG